MENNTIENIDIGGVSLIRASAKNYEHVSILTDPIQYDTFMSEFKNVSPLTRHKWAKEAFLHTSNYDTEIFNYFNNTSNLPLKYGMNPHQSPAFVNSNNSFQVLNGNLGYINVLDCLHGWLMV